ncbi:hypothetical protein LT493_31945 [Streptomyces tricolor]|nr:hypothetical protein [Streptomyces tricolor]
MYGFPDGDDGGRWHGATLVAARGRDSQVQLRPLTPGELASPGFSGGGVVDHATDRVIGIVLSVDEGPGSAFSYMSPTETILSHLAPGRRLDRRRRGRRPAAAHRQRRRRRPARRPVRHRTRLPGSAARAGRSSSPSSPPAVTAPGPCNAPSPSPTANCAPTATPAPSATTRPRPCPRPARTTSPWRSRD